jgi:hypothetical protein
MERVVRLKLIRKSPGMAFGAGAMLLLAGAIYVAVAWRLQMPMRAGMFASAALLLCVGAMWVCIGAMLKKKAAKGAV